MRLLRPAIISSLPLSASQTAFGHEAVVVHYWVARFGSKPIGVAQFDSETVFFLGFTTLSIPLPLYWLVALAAVSVAGLCCFWLKRSGHTLSSGGGIS